MADPKDRASCIARGGTWENGVCFMPDTKEEKVKGRVSSRDPAREELRQKQLATDPLFAEKLRVIEERKQQQIITQAQEELKTPEQKAIEEEQLKVQTEEQPVRRELDPERLGIEKVPVVGPLLKGAFDKVLFYKGGSELSKEAKIQPEEMRTIVLSAIEKQEVERGLTGSERFGEFVEAIPIIGSIAAKYAGGLIETPSENTQTILKELKTEKTRATNAEIKVKDGTLSVQAGQEIIEDIDNNIQRMESRMKMLISHSPELKFNSDGVNFIETKILEARERLFAAKINIVEGASSDPSDITILQSLKGSIELEDFTIPNR